MPRKIPEELEKKENEAAEAQEPRKLTAFEQLRQKYGYDRYTNAIRFVIRDPDTDPRTYVDIKAIEPVPFREDDGSLTIGLALVGILDEPQGFITMTREDLLASIADNKAVNNDVRLEFRRGLLIRALVAMSKPAYLKFTEAVRSLK